MIGLLSRDFGNVDRRRSRPIGVQSTERYFRPITRVAGFDRPFRKFGQVRRSGLETPVRRGESAQKIEVMALWEISAQEDECTLDSLLGCLLGKPTGLPGNAEGPLCHLLGTGQVFPGEAQPPTGFGCMLSFVPRSSSRPAERV